MRITGYIRVSTDEQASSGLGLDAQRATLEAEAGRRGWELVEVIADEGVSGGRTAEDRPGFAAVLETLADGRAEGVLVAKFSKPAGTALFHGQIIQAHLLAAGIPAERIAIASQLGHSLSAFYDRACFAGVAEAR